MAQPTAFLSYDVQDYVIASRLAKDLESAGAFVRHSAAPYYLIQTADPEDYLKPVEAVTEPSDYFIVVYTENARHSSDVFAEMGAAERLKREGKLRKLILYKVEPVKPYSYYPGEEQYTEVDGGAASSLVYYNAVPHLWKLLGLLMYKTPETDLPQAPQTIFICYRRLDSAGYPGRLHDDLARHYGKDRVFMDLSGLEPGVDYVARLEEAVSSCGVLLAVIGRSWLTITHPSTGSRRLDDPEDLLRMEITMSLQGGKLVIPVLVHGTSMPKAVDLPEDLKPLARRQAHEITDSRWEYDAGKLIERLDRVFKVTTVPATTDAKPKLQTSPANSTRTPLTGETKTSTGYGSHHFPAFAGETFYESCNRRNIGIVTRVQKLTDDELFVSDDIPLIVSLMEGFKLQPPEIDFDNKIMDIVPPSAVPKYMASLPSAPYVVQYVRYVLPVRGDAELLRLAPWSAVLLANRKPTEVFAARGGIAVYIEDLGGDTTKTSVDAKLILDNLQENGARLCQEVEGYNSSVGSTVRIALEQEKERRSQERTRTDTLRSHLTGPAIPQQQSPLDLNLKQFAQHEAVRHRPHIAPIGASTGGLLPDGRLQADSQHTITLENRGESIASDIRAVFFPSSKYREPGAAEQSGPTLLGTYWEGHLDTAMASGNKLPMLLTERRGPLKGEDRVTPQWELYAPEQPTFGSSLLGANPFYSGRLTITYRDNTGTPLITVFDFNGARAYSNMGDVWLQRSYPIVIESDLGEFIQQRGGDRMPPRYGE